MALRGVLLRGAIALPLALFVVVAVSAASTGTSRGGFEDASPRHCPPVGNALAGRSSKSELYVLADREGVTGEVWACDFASPPPRHLGRLVRCHYQPMLSNPYCSGIELPTLAGNLVAFDEHWRFEEDDGAATGSDSIVVVRLVDGSSLVKGASTGEEPPPKPFPVGDGPPLALVLQADGGVAWTAGSPEDPEGYEVMSIDARHRRRLFAWGHGISPRSLALSAHVLSWTQNGRRRTARLR